jgi:hypothetical protein
MAINSLLTNKSTIFFLKFQSGYFLLTAIWPLIDVNSFMAVTGPKTDIWLVKTVALLLLATAVFYITAIVFKAVSSLVMVNAFLMSFALAFIDFYYFLNGTISVIYTVDGFIQIIFIISSGISIYRPETQNNS